MNNQQRDHLFRRIDDIGREHLDHLESTMWKVWPMTPVQIIEGVRNGSLQLKAASECFTMRAHYGKTTEQAHFQDFDECVILTDEQRNGSRPDEYWERRSALLREAQEIKDRAMLGGVKEALEALKSFESKYARDEDRS